MTKEDCIRIFNASIRGTPVDFNKDIIPLISDYLTEIKCEKTNEIISLIVQNPQLATKTIPTIIDYYCRKYCILSICKIDPLASMLSNSKVLLYYD